MSPHTSEYPATPANVIQPLPPNYNAPPVPLPGEPTATHLPGRDVMAPRVRVVSFTERRVMEPLPTLARPRIQTY